MRAIYFALILILPMVAGGQTQPPKFLSGFTSKGSASFGTTALPASSSLIDMVSLTKGLLIPRMSTAQRNAIASPANGLRVFDTNLNQDVVYSNGAWAKVPFSGAIADSDIATGALINVQKLAPLTPGVLVASDASGFLTATATTPAALTSAIGKITNVVTPAADKAFEVASTTGGFIGPRMSTTQRDAIASPSAGLEIFNTTTSKKQIFTGTGWQDVGSGSGSGGSSVNYATNSGGFESGLTGWNLYKNTAGSLPTNATGGTVTGSTLGTTTTSPIGLTTDALFTKTAVNAQGEGLSTDFTIKADDAFVGSIQHVEFSMAQVSGTFASGDLVAGVIDLTSGAILTSQQLYSNVSKFYLSYPLAAANTTYRFFIHVSSTSTSAYSFKFNRFVFGPMVQAAPTAIISQPDSLIQINGFNTTGGSSWANAIRLTTPTYYYSIGDAMNYVDDPATGARIDILRDGTYSFQFSTDPTGANVFAFVKNITANQTASGAANPEKRLGLGYGDAMSMTWTGPLAKGDNVRIVGDANTLQTVNYSSFSAAYVGSVKTVTAIPNQKIQIPTSEVRFDNNLAKGSTDTAVVQFSQLSKIRGDAFSVVSNSVNGTYLQMKKAGNLSISAASQPSAAVQEYISRNQAVLTAAPVQSEVLASAFVSSNNTQLAWSGRVEVGDIIRVVHTAGVTTTATLSYLSALFWEDQVNLALNTVQPIWSQSDSAVRVTGFQAPGTTNTSILRFANVEVNQGSAITYSDDIALGAKIIINEDGVYSYKLTAGSTAAALHFLVVKGQTSYANATANPSSILAWDTSGAASQSATASGQDFLTAGTVLYPISNSGGGSPNNYASSFSVTKIGKPNLTAADVTSFATNYKTQDIDQITFNSSSGNTASNYVNGVVGSQTTNGVLTVVQDATNGTTIRAIKKTNVVISGYATSAGTAQALNVNVYNSITDATSAYTQQFANANPGAVSVTVPLNAGNVVRFSASGGQGMGTFKVGVFGTSDTDSVVATSKQISSDSMNFAFKATAIDPTADPIGTYNTYTYAASGNVATIATTAPTQTTSDMNLNGLKIYTRIYSAASTAALPTRFDIFVGKNLVQPDLFLYGGGSKTLPVKLDFGICAATTNCTAGLEHTYSPTTGILSVTGTNYVAGNGAARYFEDNATTYTTGYLAFAGSSNPALLSVPALLKRVAYLKDVKPTGTAGQTLTANAYTARTLNTLEDPYGIIQNPGSFTGSGGANTSFALAAGTYAIRAKASWYTAATAANKARSKIVNVTDSIDTIIGQTSYMSGSTTDPMLNNFVDGILVVTGSKTFNLQTRVTAGSGGSAASFTEPEVYSVVEIEKLN